MESSTSFFKSRALRLPQQDRLNLEVPSYDFSNSQNAYEALCIIGLVFTSCLLVSVLFGRRGNKRHPVVIAFLSIAVLNYCNGLLPWLFNIWATSTVSGLDESAEENKPYRHFACRLNAVSASYLRTVMPSFAAAFVGEALRITWQAWNSTKTAPILADFRCDGTTSRPCFWADRSETDPKIGDPNISHSSSDSDQSDSFHSFNVSREAQDQTDLEAYSPSNIQSVLKAEEVEDHSFSIRRRSLLRSYFSILSPSTNWRGPLVLCLVPLLCGIPQLLLIRFVFIRDGLAWIFVGVVSCRVRSVAVDRLAAMVLLIVLALTAVFSAIIILIMCSTRRTVNQFGRSNLDTTFLLPIAFISAQSVVGCLIVAIIYFTSQDQYAMSLEFLGIINPMISAFVLADEGFYINWYGWIRRLIRLPNECPGLRNIGRESGSSVVKKRKHRLGLHGHPKPTENFNGSTWAPPKPSYPRCHRPISMSSVGDWEYQHEDDITSYNASAPGGKNSRSPASSRSVHLNVDRKTSQRNRKGTVSRHPSLSRKPQRVRVFRRATLRQPDSTASAKRIRTGRKVSTVEFAQFQNFSSETWVTMNEMRRSLSPLESTHSEKREALNFNRPSVPALTGLSTPDICHQPGVIVQCCYNDTPAAMWRTIDENLQNCESLVRGASGSLKRKPSKSF